MASEIVFRMTCPGCPEQYDVFLNDKQIGYVQLRHGVLTVQYPDAYGEEIFRHEFLPWRAMGYFDSDQERSHFLRLIARELWLCESVRFRIESTDQDP